PDQAICPGEIGLNTFPKKLANLSLNQEVGLSLLYPFKSGELIFAYSITFAVPTFSFHSLHSYISNTFFFDNL
ncbi:hypothetical protein HMI55_002321, partial [Coelomomyces lativittatus]